MNKSREIRSILSKSVSMNPQKATVFFKTGVGDYAEHDQFIGVTVPVIRAVAKQFHSLTFEELKGFITSSINEERLLALIILSMRYQKADDVNKTAIYNFYSNHLKWVNNWNLVDVSAHKIMGAYLCDKPRDVLIILAQSKSLWQRRVAIVATWYFIKQNDLAWTFKLAKILLNDAHDLIHKAVGWMLREAGKQDQQQLVLFLQKHAEKMPRTMLRYAIEKFPQQERAIYLRSGVKVDGIKRIFCGDSKIRKK